MTVTVAESELPFKQPKPCPTCGGKHVVSFSEGNDAHGLEIIPPHALPNQLRTCYRGIFTQEEAQAKLGGAYRVLEVCPAQCLSDDTTSDQLVAATEVIFARVS
jgi:hypothetical protein